MVKKIHDESYAQELFNIMADCAPVLLWMSRQDSLCIFFNKTWLHFTGRTLEQEWGIGWTEGIHFEDYQKCMDTYISHFNQRTLFEMEYRLRRHDGEYRWILDRGVPYYNANHEFLGFIGSCIDITESKIAKEIMQKINVELEQRVDTRTKELKKIATALKIAKTKAEKANALKSQFVSTVSHELRTPMTSITSSLDLIINEVKGIVPIHMKSLLEIAHRNSIRMMRLINDILDIEKMEAGKFKITRKPQLLLPLIEQALSSNALFAEKHNVRLLLDILCPNVKANIDEDRFIQVLDNLLSNAIKFTKPNTDVTISMYLRKNCVCITVKDCGEGISPEFKPKIFSKFEQKNGQQTTQIGSGLGLNITKSIIKQHQGSIRFETSPQGTIFIIELPVWDKD